jgi:hypothetical protein
MTPPGSRVREEKSSSYGPEFLNCLKLLYSESLRLELIGLADVLEKSFEDCARLIRAQDSSINDHHACIIEFNYLKELRYLAPPDPH